MAQIGQKRPNQDTGNSSDTDRSTKDEASLMSLSKRPATSSSSFSFRPSPLQSATKGFALRQSSLQPGLVSMVATTTSTVSPSTSAEACSDQSPRVEKSGFLKLNQESLKTVGVSSYSIMGGEGRPVMTVGGSSSTTLSVSSTRSPFLGTEKLSSGESGSSVGSARENYFAMATTQTKTLATPSSNNGLISGDENSPNSSMFPERSKSNTQSEKRDEGVEQPVFGATPRQPALPEVQAFTGEESEKNIVIISAKLYVFEGSTRTWKDRGRGEMRLNDSAKDEGVFQSRLVMRASGTYRVLLNTHLWSQMLCERANQKSIRLTAQHLNSTEDIGVYLIMGAPKDIQALFTAIDRRIQALKLNVPSSNTESTADHSDPPKTTIPSDDEEDKDESLSRHSSPDSSPETIRVRPVERPPVSIQRAQRSNSSEPPKDENDNKPPLSEDVDNTTPTSEHIS